MRVYDGGQERIVYEPLPMVAQPMGEPLVQSTSSHPAGRRWKIPTPNRVLPTGHWMVSIRTPPFLAVFLALSLLSTGFFDEAFLRSSPVDELVFPGAVLPTVPVLKASLDSRPRATEIPDAVFTRHRVSRGENLSRIAYKYGLSPLTLISVNRLEGPDDVKTGVLLIVPYRDGARLQTRLNESVAEAAGRIGTDPESIQILPGGDLFVSGIEVTRPAPATFAHDMFLYPVVGRVVTAFGSGVDELTGIPYESEGIDLAVERGTPVGASRNGRVILTGHHPSYGLYVIVSHSGQWRSFYGHLGRVDVAPGDELKAGDALGSTGDSGIARSPRLHFVLIRNGKAVDPLDHLY